MLTHKLYDLNLKTETFQFFPGMLIAFAVFVSLALVAMYTRWNMVSTKELFRPRKLSAVFMAEYLLPFEIASILLLVALIGAAMLVRRRADI